MRSSSPTAARDGLLILLAVAAGCVDAVSYLGLGEIFTAAMTGNTVLLGLSIGQGKGRAALRSIAALAGFVAGAVVGRVIAGRGRESAVWPPLVTLAFAAELAVLIAFAFGWYLSGEEPVGKTLSVYPLIAGAGLAMGIQSAAVRRLDVRGVATTYVTGTLTSLAAQLVDRLRAPRPDDRDAAPTGRATPEQTPGLRAFVWLAYGGGAMAGGAVSVWWPAAARSPLIANAGVNLRWQPVALVLPIVLVATVVIGAAVRYQYHPSSVSEDKARGSGAGRE